MAAFSAPEVAAAFKNIFSNPAYITKYQSNPMVMALVTETVSKIGGMGGSGGMGYWWARRNVWRHGRWSLVSSNLFVVFSEL